MARVIWKGAVSFGLVHIPVALVPATVQRGVDFDWLDRRSMDPVGYKRINKVTGQEIAGEDIVRGVQVEKHRYVVLADDEIRAAYPAATRTVDIVAFVAAGQIPPHYFDTPYYLAPEARGEKVYALLREALAGSGQAGLAKVVLRNTQHLAVLMPSGPGLLLNTLRWPDEVRDIGEVGLPRAAIDARLDPRELEMAGRLIADMREEWEPARYKNEFATQIMDLVERKARQGKLETVGAAAEEPTAGAEVIDLAELLRRSLGRKDKAPEPAGRAAGSGRRSRRKSG
ncbi:MAG TPA: Ku protein [Azonexus sp.]